MWRRIHSNRDPRDTLFSELQKEFGTYFVAIRKGVAGVLSKNPKLFYGLMVAMMAVSMILSFTVFRHRQDFSKPPVSVKKTIAPVQDGFSQILAATGKIKETLRLKSLVDSISSKKALTTADSIALDSALSRLQQINLNH